MTDIAGERARLAAQGLVMLTREQWGARQSYTSDRRVNRPARWLFLHITVTADPADTIAAESAACRQVEAIGQQRFGIGWSYNGGVMQSGRLYEGQPLTRRGAHTVNDLVNPNFPAGSLNYDARALALVQNVSDLVTDAQIDAAARWGAALRRSGEAVPNARWYGHRDVTQKSCPGDKGYARLGQLNVLTDHYTAVGLGQPSKEEDEMITVIAPPSDTGDGRYWAALMDGYVRIFNSFDPGNLDPQTVWCPNEEYNLGVGVLYKTVQRVELRNYDVMVASAKRRPAESPPPP